MAIGPRTRVLLIAAVLFGAVAALVWYLSYHYWSQPVTPLRPPSQDVEQLPTPAASPPPNLNASPSPTPEVSPTLAPTPAATPTPGASPQAQGLLSDPSSSLASMRLLIPVEGVAPNQLQDTFKDARSEGRVHDAIDIIAPRGTPVLAATDGRVVKLFNSAKGGITFYQLAAADEHYVLYYAHLERYADGLAEGHVARRGETLAYVGDTGNATPGNTHLHFQIYRVEDPRHFWTGENLNPYPLLRGTQ
ncbi:MAG: peptidoglycan LD-endopeptidase LytH [Acidobacteriota bacterium]|jgi:murein DD-endopeptidase MepM/ murein hydrolase activator NlpD|nr:peptidoglycan LD-endopeptidase LytH [Acidobacteriota bacterium]